MRSVPNTPDADEILSARDGSSVSPAVVASPAPMISSREELSSPALPPPPPALQLEREGEEGGEAEVEVEKKATSAGWSKEPEVVAVSSRKEEQNVAEDEIEEIEAKKEAREMPAEESVAVAAAASHNEEEGGKEEVAVKEEQAVVGAGDKGAEAEEEKAVGKLEEEQEEQAEEETFPVPLQREATMVAAATPVKEPEASPPKAHVSAFMPPKSAPSPPAPVPVPGEATSPVSPKTANPFSAASPAAPAVRPSANPFAKSATPSRNPFAAAASSSPSPAPAPLASPVLSPEELTSLWHAASRASWAVVEQLAETVDKAPGDAAAWSRVEAIMAKSVPVHVA